MWSSLRVSLCFFPEHCSVCVVARFSYLHTNVCTDARCSITCGGLGWVAWIFPRAKWHLLESYAVKNKNKCAPSIQITTDVNKVDALIVLQKEMYCNIKFGVAETKIEDL